MGCLKEAGSIRFLDLLANLAAKCQIRLSGLQTGLFVLGLVAAQMVKESARNSRSFDRVQTQQAVPGLCAGAARI